MQLKQIKLKSKTGRIVSCLTILTVLFSFLWMALPDSASASGTPATSLTVKLNDTTLATYSSSDLENMTQVTQGFSSIDSMPAPCMTAAQGVKVADILTRAGLDVNSVQNITFKSTDGYAMSLTKQYLLDTNRYYYPNITSYWDSDNKCTYGAALNGGVQVDPILALKSYYKRFVVVPEFDLMDNKYSLRLCFGQDPNNITDITSSKFAKYVNEINVDGNLLPASPPVLVADTTDNTVSQPVTLTFTDDAFWRAAITGITVDGAALTSSQYSVAAGAITINAGVFASAGNYNIAVNATGYSGTSVTQTMKALQVTVTMNLSKSTAAVGESVTVSGYHTPYGWITVKVLDSGRNIVVFDATTADADGIYRINFIIPDTTSEVLTAVAGVGSNVVNKAIAVSTTLPSDTNAPTWNNGSLSTANVNKTGLTLNWSGATDDVGVTGYKVYQDSSLLTNSTVAGTSYSVTGLSADTRYSFAVQAVDAAGNESTDGPGITVTTKSSGGSSGGGGGGGSSTTPQTVSSTTGTATVTPGAGGTISLGSEVIVKVPANALVGTSKVEVKVEKVTTASTIPTGFKLAGSVYEFSVGGKSTYSFNKNITLTFSFDPSAFSQGEVPTVYYYDEALAKWVNLGGTVSGSTITVQVDHFTKYAVMAVKETVSEPVVVKTTDITGHWAQENINKLVAIGAIKGYPDGSFKPDKTISRAEFATVLVKAFKLAPQSGKVFADTANHWAKNDLATAASYGIVGGYDETTFGPDDLITREQMAVMIVKAAKLNTLTEEPSFADSENISDWARAAVTTATGNGIMKGYPDNTMRPQGNTTRAEAVTVIANTLK